MSLMDFFKNHNNKKDNEKNMENTVDDMITELKKAEKEMFENDKIVRVAFVFKEDNSFRPTTYMSVEDNKVNLFEDSDKMKYVKEKILESNKEIDDEPIKHYVIMEFPFMLPHDILKLETYFALLNPQLDLTPDQCNILPIGGIIKDDEISSALKFQALVINYATKVFRMINFGSENKNHIDYEIVSNEMRITPKGCVEKYGVKLFDKYDLTFYSVNEEEK